MERYQTAWRRIVASLIDDFIMVPLIVGSEFFRQWALPREFFWFWIPLTALIPLIYTIWMTAQGGQTLGKMAFGVQVVSFPDERPIGLNESLKRAAPEAILALGAVIMEITFFGIPPEDPGYARFGQVFFSILLGWNFGNFASFLINEKRRAVHDLIAGTVVVRTEENAVRQSMDN